MARSSCIALLFLASLTSILAQGIYSCTSFFIPLTVTNITTVVPPFPFPLPDGYAVTSVLNSITVRDPPPSTASFTQVSGLFNISAEYCTPDVAGPKASTVQILTHGLGFSKKYWDFRLPSAPDSINYSYVDATVTAGYSTLSWDRLGCGKSTIADPYTEIQVTVELELLAQLTTLTRRGQLGHDIPTPQKIVHVGHSWGSELSNSLAAGYPGYSDGLILTGFSGLLSYGGPFIISTDFWLASNNQPARFGNLSSGYITWSGVPANQYSFFAYPYFQPAVIDYAESTKYPFTLGEIISQTAFDFNATTFTGPVLYLASEKDWIFCQGDCSGLYGPNSTAVLDFPSSSSVDVVIQPDVGHALNLHENATAAFAVANEWLSSHGF